MALLDTILGDLAQSAQNPDVQSQVGNLVQSVLNGPQGQALTQHINDALAQTPYGNIEGVVTQLQQSGLASHVESWLSGGPNTPVDPAKVEGALKPGLDALSSSLGLPPETLPGILSQVLPAVIDKLSPNGTLQTPPAAPAAPAAPTA